MGRTYSSPTVVGSRKTSKYGPRGGSFHAGQDYAPPKPGQTGVPIYAVTDGTVTKVGNGGVLPGHTGKGVLINHGDINGDNVESYYGHLATYSVKVGQRVKFGQLIGVMGTTGNSSGIHLHFTVRLNHLQYIDPDVWITSKGITVGKTPPISTTVPVVSKKPKPSPVKSVVSDKVVQTRLKKTGNYKGIIDGKEGNLQRAAVKSYQQGQKYGKLLADGKWGAETEAHYQWTIKLQNALNQWKGGNLSVDGHLGNSTIRRVREVMQNNKGGAYKGLVDGVPGSMFAKMLGIPAHP